MKNKEAIPPLNRLIRYFLDKYKHRILDTPFTSERSAIVSAIDYLLEADREAHYDR